MEISGYRFDDSSECANDCRAMADPDTSPASSVTQLTTSPLISRQTIGELKQEATTAALTANEYLHEALRFAPRLLGALIILVLAWMVSSWARKKIYTTFNRPEFDQTLVRFFSTASKWAVLIVALVACLAMLGIETTSVLTIMGAAGLAVGLAIQGSLANLASGIMLLILRPFRVGDVINVAGVTGKVDEIELFNTKIDTGDNRRVIIPNGQVFGGVIDNQTHHRTRSVAIVLTVSHDADIEQTRAAFWRAIKSVPDRLADPAPSVLMNNIVQIGVEWQATVWCLTDRVAACRETLLANLKIALREAGIDFAVPRNQGAPKPFEPVKALEAGAKSQIAEVPATNT
jgi:small conductance mechanosensitive channel